jgi:L-threonylcarbamoyladenylate synthase
MRVVTADENGIKTAAHIIKAGGLAVIPTETVYGLAADAFCAKAVGDIYAVKGRPNDNPLILHIADKPDLDKLTDDLPGYAKLLTDAFWPGPMTLVVRKKEGLPPWLGSHPHNTVDTVAVRMPNHPVTLEIIKESGCIVAAPSANKAGKPSPTNALHVENDYKNEQNKPDILVDGGTTDVGVESTVIDVTGDKPVLLRPGAITKEMIQNVCNIIFDENGKGDCGLNLRDCRSPGMKYRHYSPKAPMILLSGTTESVASYITTQIIAEVDAYIGVLVSPQVLACVNKNWPIMAVQCDSDSVYTPVVKFLPLGDPHDLTTVAKNLFANLRSFDELGVDLILAQALPPVGLGAAIMDRMTKAALGRVVQLGERPS